MVDMYSTKLSYKSKVRTKDPRIRKAPGGKAGNNHLLEQFPSQAEDIPFKGDPTRAFVYFPGGRMIEHPEPLRNQHVKPAITWSQKRHRATFSE